MGFPNDKQIEEALKRLESVEPTRVIDRKNASPVDLTKYDLCAVFVRYMLKNKISQVELAKQLGIDKGRLNKIVKYRIEYFTIDKLLELLNHIKPQTTLKVS